MNYSEFKEWLTEFLWKSGDTVLQERLDSLITMGTSELERKLKVQDREVGAYLYVVSEEHDLPEDYSKMRLVGNEWNYVTPSELEQLRDATNSGTTQSVYSLRANKLLLCGPFNATNPYELFITYQAKLPDFKTDDASWLADNYLDLYTYTCLKHAAPFIREDERIQIWASLALDALESVLEDDAHNRARSASARLRLPRAASS